jgi:hypothetical protein
VNDEEESTRIITIRPSKSSVLGMRGHVLWVDSKSANSSSSFDLPIEGGVLFLLVVMADIALLAVSGRFTVVPRDLVRWVGGVFLTLVALWTLVAIAFFGAVGVIGAVFSSLDSKPRRIPITGLISVVVVAAGFGVLLGASAVIGGPVDLAPDAALLVGAAWVWRGSGKPHRWLAGRDLLAEGLAIAGATGAVVGVLLLQHA